MPLIKMAIHGIEFDLLLCAKEPEAENMVSSEHTISKKSLSSIQGFECTAMIENIIHSLKITNGFYIFKEVTKILKYFTK